MRDRLAGGKSHRARDFRTFGSRTITGFGNLEIMRSEGIAVGTGHRCIENRLPLAESKSVHNPDHRVRRGRLNHGAGQRMER